MARRRVHGAGDTGLADRRDALAQNSADQQAIDSPTQFHHEVASISDLVARTEDQQARARFFSRWRAGGAPLRAGDVISGIAEHLLAPGNEPPSYQGFISRLACSAPMALVGRAAPRSVHLTSPGTWLFTTYALTVERWLWTSGPVADPLELVSLDGGAWVDGKRTSTGGAGTFRPNTRYLVFLVGVPDSVAVAVADFPVQVRNGWTSDLKARHDLPVELKEERVTFDRFIHDLTASRGQCRGALR